MALLFTAIMVARPLSAQTPPVSSATEATKDAPLNLPVSIDKIRGALEQPTPIGPRLRGLHETPHFRVEIQERQKFTLEELIKSLDFKSGPVPAGGLYAYEQQRLMWPAVDNPLVQPYAAFNQGQLLTVLIENLVGKYLAGRAMNAVSSAERTHAEAVARDEVRQAVAEYCAAQPNGGAGIQICSTPIQ